jgi:hypothetical protein
MACRRVLSSTPLLVRGSETGGDSGESALLFMPLVNSQHLLNVFVQLANKRGLKKNCIKK